MAHTEQWNFVLKCKSLFLDRFLNKSVLDVGSLDINGTTRILFKNCDYTGIDIISGRNVDVVCPAHLYNPGKQYDVIISTECWEHDEFWMQSNTKIIELLKPGGLYIFTCASTGRPEHGTKRTVALIPGFALDYYRNLTEQDFRNLPGFIDAFKDFSFEYCRSGPGGDLYFWGFKKE